MSRTVTVGVDGSPESLAAADWAAREAVLHGAELRVVHAGEQQPHAYVPFAGEAVAPPGADRSASMLRPSRSPARPMTSRTGRPATSAPGGTPPPTPPAPTAAAWFSPTSTPPAWTAFTPSSATTGSSRPSTPTPAPWCPARTA
ncbi:universal stress protein [Streptomyces bobili]|uniref:universal stress protein n=1 Tax=Streptomyces bobili TaxID=67280 RepID=UPI003659C068